MGRWEPGAEGRLALAALALFDERGYDETTVAEIAEAAGLTKRTFFRYFADKREVLFDGSNELRDRWISGIETAPADEPALQAVSTGLDGVAEMFTQRHEFARLRARVVTSNPELLERELIKLQFLSTAITTALVQRGVPMAAATLAAQAGVTVFHTAFARWIGQDDPAAFRRLMDETFAELRAVTTA